MNLWLIPLNTFLRGGLACVDDPLGRNVCAAGTGLATLLALAKLLSHAPAVYRGEIVQTQLEWLPQIACRSRSPSTVSACSSPR